MDQDTLYLITRIFFRAGEGFFIVGFALALAEAFCLQDLEIIEDWDVDFCHLAWAMMIAGGFVSILMKIVLVYLPHHA